jgi:hypothetical protein
MSRDQPEADIAPAVMPVELVQEQRAPELWVTGFAIARSAPLPSSASRPWLATVSRTVCSVGSSSIPSSLPRSGSSANAAVYSLTSSLRNGRSQHRPALAAAQSSLTPSSQDAALPSTQRPLLRAAPELTPSRRLAGRVIPARDTKSLRLGFGSRPRYAFSLPGGSVLAGAPWSACGPPADRLCGDRFLFGDDRVTESQLAYRCDGPRPHSPLCQQREEAHSRRRRQDVFATRLSELF